MELESESYGVDVRELWSKDPRVMDLESESYGVGSYRVLVGLRVMEFES